MGFLHPLHFSLFPFKEQSLYGVTRPQFVHLANLSSFASLSLMEWLIEMKDLSGVMDGIVFSSFKRIKNRSNKIFQNH